MISNTLPIIGTIFVKIVMQGEGKEKGKGVGGIDFSDIHEACHKNVGFILVVVDILHVILTHFL